MAIRRPSIYAPQWLFQDFLYMTDGAEELRYIQVKYDGEIYTRVSQTFDYSDPPYTGDEQRGGQIVASLSYSKVGKLITVTDWEINWRDEWPLRLATNYLVNCLYTPHSEYSYRIAKDAYPFWVSEAFFPITNSPTDYMYQ